MPSAARRHTLVLLPETYCVCRLLAERPLPVLPVEAGFVSVTRTAAELSLVLPEEYAPPGARVERGFRAFSLEGSLPFELVGVLASVLEPLAAVGVSIFAVSTFDTDTVLVREEDRSRAEAALRAAGHTIRTEKGKG